MRASASAHTAEVAPDASVQVITQREAAAALGVNRSTISEWCATGKLRSIRTGEHRGATRGVADQRYHALLERRQTVG